MQELEEEDDGWELGSNTQGILSDTWFQITEREDPVQNS